MSNATCLPKTPMPEQPGRCHENHVHHAGCLGHGTRRKFLQTVSLLALAGCAGGGSGFDMPVLLSAQDEVQLGNDAWQQILNERPQSTNSRLKRQVERVATRIIDTTGSSGMNWEFALFEDSKVNAFALPGGKVGVYTGLFNVADNDAQLAAVLGHEISHVTARHAAKRISTQMMGDLAVKAAQFGLQGAGVGGSQQIAGLIGAGVSYGVVLPFSRQQETEADVLGLEAMAKAAYNPQEALEFWRKMSSQGNGAPRWAEFASTHPADGRRIETLANVIPQKMPLYEQAVRQRGEG